jgi:hypothetical protein
MISKTTKGPLKSVMHFNDDFVTWVSHTHRHIRKSLNLSCVTHRPWSALCYAFLRSHLYILNIFTISIENHENGFFSFLYNASR